VDVEGRTIRILVVELDAGYFEWVHGPFLLSARAIFARVTPNHTPVVYRRFRVEAKASESMPYSPPRVAQPIYADRPVGRVVRPKRRPS
jgi:hypothetical protein